MGWETKKLGDVCKTSAGGTPLKSQKKYYDNGTIPWLRSGEVCKRDINESELFITNEGLASSSAKLFPPETVLVAMYGATAGQSGILRFECSTNQAVCGLLPSKKVIPEFLCYYFINSKDYLVGQAVGNAQPNISQMKIKDLRIPLPPLETQARIVSIVDSAFADIERARANAEKNLKNARELFDSYLNKVFSQRGEGWKETTLGESCEFSNGKAHEKSIDENGVFIVVNSKFISQAGAVVKRTNELKHPLNIGDIAMVMSDVPNGKALAKCFIVPEENKYSLNQRICSIKSDLFFTQFLYYQLNRNPFLLAFDNKGSQANLRKDEILSCPLWLPSIEKQQEISSKLDSLMNHTDSLLDAYNNKLASLDELKQSLLQKAFSGELTEEDEGIAA